MNTEHPSRHHAEDADRKNTGREGTSASSSIYIYNIYICSMLNYTGSSLLRGGMVLSRLCTRRTI